MDRRHHPYWPKGAPFELPPMPFSVLQNLATSAARAPDRTAIVYYGARTSYRALWDQVQALAGYLHDVAGLRADDRVAICLQNAPQFIVAYYAVLAANAVIVPITPMSRRAELRHILTDSGAKAVIYGSELAQEIAAIHGEIGAPARIEVRYGDALPDAVGADVPPIVANAAYSGLAPRWDAALAAGHSAPPHDRGAQDWCIIPYSSGTTGLPKGCLHRHASVNATIQAYPPWIGMKEGARVLATLPFCHVTGMQHSMNLPIYMGATIYLFTRWDAATAARLIAEERVQHWRSITTMMVDFLSLPGIEDLDVSSLETVGGGGAQMPQALAQKLRDMLGLDYVEAYGLSETMAPTHINPVHRPKQQCLGIPIFGVDSRIIDPETGTELGPNQVGEIVSHGPQVFVGYWQRPEDTRAAFLHLDGKPFFRTGDIGYMDEEGYFFFTDRLKRMVNVSGLKVWPAEVEAILHGHDAIHEACIVGDPDPRTGESVRAVIVVRDGAPRPSAQDLTDWCRRNMAAYKVPQRFEYRGALPRSGAGKVLWKEL